MKTFYASIFLISLLFFTNACKKQISKEIETSSTENYLPSTQSNVNSGSSAFQKIYSLFEGFVTMFAEFQFVFPMHLFANALNLGSDGW